MTVAYPLLRLRRDMPSPRTCTPGHWAISTGRLRIRCACGAPAVMLPRGYVVSNDAETLEGVVEPSWECASCKATYRLRLQSYVSRRG